MKIKSKPYFTYYIYHFKNKFLNQIKLFFPLFVFVSFKVLAQSAIYGDLSLFQNAEINFFNTSVHFITGNITADDTNNAQIIFSNTQPQNAKDVSHADLSVLSRNSSAFVFPTGNQGIYQPLFIDNADQADLTVRFHHNAHEDPFLTDEIDKISDQFFWEVLGNKNAVLGLSWNPSSLLHLLTDNLENLTILGHTADGWEIIPSQLGAFAIDEITPTSFASGSIISRENINFNQYDALTLGSILKPTSIFVSEALTPNGDNVNDTWFIEHIERYSEAVIRVFNRWGAEVFFHQGSYNNDWNGTSRATNKSLPAAPYYYRIDLDNDGYIEHEGWIYINY